MKSKAWDWEKNQSDYWLTPCVESPYLAERWQSRGFLRFLDLGCGLGRHAVYMAQKGFEVTAADLSECGVAHTQKWAGEEQVPLTACVADMLDLPFEDNTFDCALAYNVIYHTDIAGFQVALAEIRRVLRPGGELFLTLISKSSYGYEHADSSRRIDANTLLSEKSGTETGVPHLYVDLADIQRFFKDWQLEDSLRESCVHNLEAPQDYSTHWSLMVRK
ncbi:class I SAM-dependent methyltransferase [Eubacterium sp. 1001713B170207_170306_E7]|uniref:class I SAM-dependent methyltransferase n=1 Tax=Eubacterium sp. 1001713B170207_170306_E7 TaxID=2787097 RepID=UPI00189C0060|nr:class I SAM-dependent methyltransferase [Eubacterium sp. 1001713B170207_170306_E7]